MLSLFNSYYNAKWHCHLIFTQEETEAQRSGLQIEVCLQCSMVFTPCRLFCRGKRTRRMSKLSLLGKFAKGLCWVREIFSNRFPWLDYFPASDFIHRRVSPLIFWPCFPFLPAPGSNSPPSSLAWASVSVPRVKFREFTLQTQNMKVDVTLAHCETWCFVCEWKCTCIFN